MRSFTAVMQQNRGLYSVPIAHALSVEAFSTLSSKIVQQRAPLRVLPMQASPLVSPNETLPLVRWNRLVQGLDPLSCSGTSLPVPQAFRGLIVRGMMSSWFRSRTAFLPFLFICTWSDFSSLLGNVLTLPNVAPWKHSLKEEVGRRRVDRESFLTCMPHPKTQGKTGGASEREGRHLLVSEQCWDPGSV